MTIAKTARAFVERRRAKCHNAYTDGERYVLHRTAIAMWDGDYIRFAWGGWYTPTTANHMNHILDALDVNERVSYRHARELGTTGFIVACLPSEVLCRPQLPSNEIWSSSSAPSDTTHILEELY